jgi:integrase
VERAGITGNVVIHSLRHTRNTRLKDAGVEQKIRMGILGHTSEAVNDIYTHTNLSDQLEAVKKLREHAGKAHRNNVVIPAAFGKR